ncbi:HAD family phosphatase [Candidatus Woesearchaeota archaeon]|nr:HAD family phosphatase [Candidatus Woesearchaeota archaeon]
MKNTVIFDLDGVITDSEPLRYATYRKLFRDNYGVNLPEKMDKRMIGKSQKGKKMRALLNRYNLKGDIKELIQKRAVLLDEASSKKENIKPINGLFELLKSLQSHKFKLAIASSSGYSYVTNILDCLGLKDVFEAIVTGEMVDKGKPNPDIFLLAAKKLGKKSKDCVVIEDSYNGIAAAKAANMKVIAITTYFSRKELSSADMFVDDLSQIKLSDIKNI